MGDGSLANFAAPRLDLLGNLGGRKGAVSIQDLGDGRANGLARRWGDLFPPGRVNICFLFSYKNNTLRLKLANLPGRLANLCSRYGLHRVARHAFFVGTFDVALHLRQREVTTDRSDLRRAAPCLGQPPAHCFSEPMGGITQR
jgi:hypothetical protein